MGEKNTVSPPAAKRCRLCGQRFTNEATFCPFDGEMLEECAWEPGSDPLIGAVIDDRYKVIESLGEGGMGSVYKVRHRTLDRHFAMKVLRKELAREAELCGRFIQEARTIATINHPSVVQITDYGTLPGGIPYLVMEYLEGMPLSKITQKGGPMPAGRAVRILLQVAAGLGAAHRVGVVHRDLKPDNIFILGDIEHPSRAKILDFGVAKVAGGSKYTRTGVVFGSPHYMSPEQASGQPVDHRADIYALGVVMYELFTGRVPFEADTYMGVLTKHMFVAPEPFGPLLTGTKDLGALEAITLRCLEKKPEHRYPTVDALIAEIEAVVELGSEEDDLQVRPSRASGSVRPMAFRLADELEVPLAGEIAAARRGRDRGRLRAPVAIAALVVAALAALAAFGVLLWAVGRKSGAQHAQERAESASSAAPRVAVELVEEDGAAPIAPATATVSAVASAADRTERPMPRSDLPSGPAVRPRAAREEVPEPSAEPAPPVRPKTGARRPGGSGSEIVDPWAQ